MKFYSSLFTLVCALLICTVKAQEGPASAEAIMKEARAQAAREKKNVFVIFHASWCGWCHAMDSAMNDNSCRDLFRSQYVIRHLTVMERPEKKQLENPGAAELLQQYHGDKQGIPFWLVFDKNGQLLADSQLRPAGAGLDTPGSNVGCPAKDEEVDYFVKVLHQTTSLNDKQIGIIAARFRKINAGH